MPLTLSGTVTISNFDHVLKTPFGDTRVPGATVFSGAGSIQLDDASVDALSTAIAEKLIAGPTPVPEQPKKV